MATIDIGTEAIDRNDYSNAGYTYINDRNPANATGTVTNVDVYLVGTTTIYVGIFYLVGGTAEFKCRSAYNAGSLTVGLHHLTVSLAVVAGDLIGIYGSAGHDDVTTNAADKCNVWYSASNTCAVNNETTYSNYSVTWIFSLYGTGATPPGPANLKSLNTNILANIKTINGNPIANVKSLDTIV